MSTTPAAPSDVPAGLAPPAVVFRGHHWSADELTELAARWRACLGDEDAPLVAVVMANHPQAIAAFFAATGGSRAVIVLPPAPPAWNSEPPLPGGTRLVLPPVLARFARAGEALGLRPAILPEPAAGASPGPGSAGFLTTPGLVLFTSGSTGAPKPVYRTVSQVLGSSTRMLDLLDIPRGAGIAGTLPLSTAHGVTSLLEAAERRGTLGLLERFEPARALSLFASRRFDYWPGVPVMAERLTWLAAQRPSRRWQVPRVCTVAGAALTEAAWHAFREQFGVPLRAIYGSTEVGVVTIDAAPADEVRPGGAGRVATGVEVRIGDDPRASVPAGEAGRIWVRSPLCMEGYGYPPRLEAEEAIDGWRPMRDRGRMTEDGHLTVVGRTDEAFKTRAGYLVEPRAITAALSACPGVTEAVVVPIASQAGIVPGALVEVSGPIEPSDLRRRLAAGLPSWCQPVVLHVVDALPRLATGKIDRRRCSAILLELAGHAPK